MDGRGVASRLTIATLCLLPGACHSGRTSDDTVPISRTLEGLSRRVSATQSLRSLNHMATNADALVRTLSPSERDHLGRDYLRFDLKKPTTIFVAAPGDSAPFWLPDQGFTATEATLRNQDSTWRLYRKSAPAGTVGLGVNGLDRTPPGHYAVFLKPVEAPRSDVGDLVGLRESDRPDWHAIRVDGERGISPAFDTFRPFERMPAELIGTVLLQARHDRRHSTLLAPARIWKTHVASGETPDQITIAFGADASREIVWNWRTRPEVEKSFLRLKPDDASPTNRAENADVPNALLIEGESKLYETLTVLNDRAIRRHRVAVEGLEPDRSYLYSIGDGSERGWTPWKRVRTGPSRSTPIQFLYLGDAQTGLEGWGHRLENAYRQFPDARFTLLAGDLVDRGNERTNWDHFFLRSAGVFDRLPLMPCVGNHEYLDQGPQLFKMFFDLPKNGPKSSEPDLVYSFEYGDAFFAILDSTMAVSSPKAAEEQANWLDQVLGNTRATWKFVMFHHPVYASRKKRDNLPLQRHWVPIFDKHHVDVVFQGHDHTYIRTHPMRGNHRAESPQNGTFYVVSVSGDKFYDQESRGDYAVARTNLPTYQVIDIDPNSGRLNYRSMTESAETIDAFEIAKSSKAQPVQFARTR